MYSDPVAVQMSAAVEQTVPVPTVKLEQLRSRGDFRQDAIPTGILLPRPAVTPTTGLVDAAGLVQDVRSNAEFLTGHSAPEIQPPSSRTNSSALSMVGVQADRSEEVRNIQRLVRRENWPYNIPLLFNKGEMARCDPNPTPTPRDKARWASDGVDVLIFGNEVEHEVFRQDNFACGMGPVQLNQTVHDAFPTFEKFYMDYLVDKTADDEFFFEQCAANTLAIVYDGEGSIETTRWESQNIIQAAGRFILRPWKRTGHFFLFRECFELGECKDNKMFFTTNPRREFRSQMDKARFWLIVCFKGNHWFLSIFDTQTGIIWWINTLKDCTERPSQTLAAALNQASGQKATRVKIVNVSQQEDKWSCWLRVIESIRSFVMDTNFTAPCIAIKPFSGRLEYSQLDDEGMIKLIGDRTKLFLRNLLGQDVKQPLFPYNTRNRRPLNTGGGCPYFKYRYGQITDKDTSGRRIAHWEFASSDEFAVLPSSKASRLYPTLGGISESLMAEGRRRLDKEWWPVCLGVRDSSTARAGLGSLNGPSKAPPAKRAKR